MDDIHTDPTQLKPNIPSFETEKGKKTNEEIEGYEYEYEDEQEEIIISNYLRNILFIILCIVYCISSCDGGIVPQQIKRLRSDFKDTGDSRFGLFGSIDYIGRILGAVVMSFLINKMNRKIFFSACCIFKGITLVISLFTETYYINIITRLISGIPQTLLTSYGTIWTDQFGKRNRRTMMLPILQLASLLGIMIGYGLGILSDFILGESEFHGWRLSFGIEGIALGILGIIILFYPNLYFSSTFYLNEDDDYKGKEKSIQKIAKERKQNNWNDFIKQFPKILCIKIYIFMSIGNTVAFFGMRVIQFYADEYMGTVLKIEKKVKSILYVVLCMTGPVLGILICGIICSKLGGYASKNGMIFIIILNIIACISSHFITLTLNPFLSLSANWLYLFCYAAVTPLQGGVIIASLPKELKGNGFSINMFLLNGIGSFPSSYIFGLIADYFNYLEESKKYRTAMMIIMFYNYLGLILIIIAGIFRFRLKGELGNNEENEEKDSQISEKEETDDINN